MSILDLDATSPGEATREFYRQQGRKQEQERIIKLLESDKRLHSYFYAEQFLKLGASVLPFVETHAKDCPGCDLIALIKGESKPFITTKQAEELTNEMLEE